jgi:hypothetical protein
VPVLWAEVDLHTEDKPGPKTVEEALGVLAEQFPYMPSVVVESGGGLHLYWLLDEPISTETREECDEAQKRVREFQGRIRTIWSARGWQLDSVHDLARVLRVPGTVNHKYPHKPEVRIRILNPEKRYGVGTLTESPEVSGIQPTLKGSVEWTGADQVKLAETLPELRAEVAELLNNPLTKQFFEPFWSEHRCREASDTSASSVVLGLLRSAAQIPTLTDDDLHALGVAYYRKRQADGLEVKVEKLGRADFWKRTIGIVREGREEIAMKARSVEARSARAMEAVEVEDTAQALQEAAEEAAEVLGTKNHSAGLRAVERLLGAPEGTLGQLAVHPTDPRTYSIEMKDEQGGLSWFELGQGDVILSAIRLRNFIRTNTGGKVSPGKIAKDSWDPVADALLRAAVPSNLVDLEHRITIALMAYELVTSARKFDGKNLLDWRGEALNSPGGCVEPDGTARFKLASVLEKLREVDRSLGYSSRVVKLLHQMGAKPSLAAIYTDGKQTTARTWVIPMTVLAELMGGEGGE